MAKEVHVLDYWMPLLRNLKEFKEIAKAEEPELEILLAEIDRTLDNMFIETADEEGIKHFEAMMGIYPAEGATLEERRFEVMVKWNDKLPYTEDALRGFLDVLCGENGYTLINDFENYTLSIKLGIASESNYEEVQKLLDRVVPANILKIILLFNTHFVLKSYTHEQLGTHTHHEVREESF